MGREDVCLDKHGWPKEVYWMQPYAIQIVYKNNTAIARELNPVRKSV